MWNQLEISWLQQIYHSKEAGTTITNLNSDISGFCNNSFTQGLNKNSAVKKKIKFYRYKGNRARVPGFKQIFLRYFMFNISHRENDFNNKEQLSLVEVMHWLCSAHRDITD